MYHLRASRSHRQTKHTLAKHQVGQPKFIFSSSCTEMDLYGRSLVDTGNFTSINGMASHNVERINWVDQFGVSSCAVW